MKKRHLSDTYRAMKHAFPRAGENRVSIEARGKGNLVSVVIEDNGVGLPGQITFANSTGFGMQLVGMLVKQIGGTISIQRERGTKFIIEFAA